MKHHGTSNDNATAFPGVRDALTPAPPLRCSTPMTWRKRRERGVGRMLDADDNDDACAGASEVHVVDNGSSNDDVNGRGSAWTVGVPMYFVGLASAVGN